MAKKRWQDLAPRTRRLIVVAAVAEVVLKVAALSDLVRRPRDRIRGSKVGWALAIAFVNSFGAVPIAYFARGRRTAGRPDSPAG